MNPTESINQPLAPQARVLLSAERISNRIKFWQDENKRNLICAGIMERLGPQLSDNVWFSPSIYITVTVSRREDLAVLMTLAPKWEKSALSDIITYSATVAGERFEIQATGDALPGTCKLVPEEYEVPAVEAKPATKATRMVVKCDKMEAGA